MDGSYINPEEVQQSIPIDDELTIPVTIETYAKRVPKVIGRMKLRETRTPVLISPEERDELVRSGLENYSLLCDKEKSVREDGYRAVQKAVEAISGNLYDLEKIKCKWSHLKTDAPRMNRRLKYVYPQFAHMRIHPKLNSSLTMILKGIPEYVAMENFDQRAWRDTRKSRKRKHDDDYEYIELIEQADESIQDSFEDVSPNSPRVMLEKLDCSNEGDSVVAVKRNPDPAKPTPTTSTRRPAAAVLKERFARIRKQHVDTARSLLGGSIKPSTDRNESRTANILARERNALIGQQNEYLREISESLKLISTNLFEAGR